MSIAIILDWTMAVMLIISIAYSWRLNKKIIDFRNSKGEFFQLVKTLDETIIRAEKNIDELKRLALLTSNELGVKLDKAKVIIDDFSFMNDRANSIIDKMDNAIKNTKRYEDINRNNFQNNSYNEQNFTKNIINKQNNIEPKAAAIESLLAKISAVRNRKETIES